MKQESRVIQAQNHLAKKLQEAEELEKRNDIGYKGTAKMLKQKYQAEIEKLKAFIEQQRPQVEGQQNTMGYKGGGNVSMPSDNTSVAKPLIKDPNAPQPDLAGLTIDDLKALSHQKMGMGRQTGFYVKSPGNIQNELGQLTSDQVKVLDQYMNNRGPLESLYYGLPNVGRMYGHSAADIPENSVLKNKNGGIPKYEDGINPSYYRPFAMAKADQYTPIGYNPVGWESTLPVDGQYNYDINTDAPLVPITDRLNYTHFAPGQKTVSEKDFNSAAATYMPRRDISSIDPVINMPNYNSTSEEQTSFKRDPFMEAQAALASNPEPQGPALNKRDIDYTVEDSLKNSTTRPDRNFNWNKMGQIATNAAPILKSLLEQPESVKEQKNLMSPYVQEMLRDTARRFRKQDDIDLRPYWEELYRGRDRAMKAAQDTGSRQSQLLGSLYGQKQYDQAAGKAAQMQFATKRKEADIARDQMSLAGFQQQVGQQQMSERLRALQEKLAARTAKSDVDAQQMAAASRLYDTRQIDKNVAAQNAMQMALLAQEYPDIYKKFFEDYYS